MIRFTQLLQIVIESSTLTHLLPLLHPNYLKSVMNTMRCCVFVALVLQSICFVPNSIIPLQLSPWHPF